MIFPFNLSIDSRYKLDPGKISENAIRVSILMLSNWSYNHVAEICAYGTEYTVANRIMAVRSKSLLADGHTFI
jgi:hypothetical protein